MFMLADNINFMCENVYTGSTKSNAKILLHSGSELFQMYEGGSVNRSQIDIKCKPRDI
jgi:hypothetical protein